MKAHEFDISINADGTVRVVVQGIKGPGCEQYISLFQEIIQGRTTVERTSEYYETEVEVETGTTVGQKW